MTKFSDIKKEIVNAINSGKAKQEVYEEVQSKYGYNRKIIDILRNTPSNAAKLKYGTLNKVLLGLVILLTLFYFFVSQSIFWTVVFCLLTYAVATYRVQYYFWLTAVMAISLIGTVAVFLIALDDIRSWWWSAGLLLIIIVPAMILPIKLVDKLCPKPKAHKKIFRDKTGKRNIEMTYEFVDV